jgi:two-component system LytT family response regulator
LRADGDAYLLCNRIRAAHARCARPLAANSSANACRIGLRKQRTFSGDQHLTIRALIVDDEEAARRGIRSQLLRHDDVHVVSECRDGDEAIQTIRATLPDVVFLDVQMSGKSGFQVLEEIELQVRPYIIFVTAYDHHALKAFDVRALDYLLKPFSEARFDEALDRARGALSQAQSGFAANRSGKLEPAQGPAASGTAHGSGAIDRIAVKTGDGRILVLRLNEVDWVEAHQDYVALHVGSKAWLVREAISALEPRLAPLGFVRIHRSTLLNVDRVRELRPLSRGEFMVVLFDGTERKLSRNYRGALDRLAGYGLSHADSDQE